MRCAGQKLRYMEKNSRTNFSAAYNDLEIRQVENNICDSVRVVATATFLEVWRLFVIDPETSCKQLVLSNQ